MDNLNDKISNEEQKQPSCLGAVMPRFYFTRFHKGTEHSGWEIAFFGFCFKWMKFPNFRKYAYWRCANFGKIAMLNRSIEFTMPRIKNEA